MSFLPPVTETGEGEGAAPAALGLAAAGDRGKAKRGPRGIDSPLDSGGDGPGGWRCHDARQRRPVAALVGALRGEGGG